MRAWILAAALALGACTQAPAGKSEQAAAGCAAQADAPWRPLSGVEFRIEAASEGPDCANAVATLVIRVPGAAPLWTDTREAAHVMTLAYAEDPAAMQAALAEWVDSSNHTFETSAALPPWPEGAETLPMNGEFPFYAEEGMDRVRYEAIRAAGVPVFCYVQGMESLACVAWHDGAFTKVGVQSFPG